MKTITGRTGLTMQLLNRMAMIRPARFLCLVPLLFFVIATRAGNPDLRNRLGISVSGDFSDKLKGGIDFQYRVYDNLSTFDKAYIEPELAYDILKPLRVDIAWRVMLDHGKSGNSWKQRPSASLRYKFGIGDFDFKVKTAIQYGFDELTNPTFSSDQKLINRNSVTVEYDWFGKKLTPLAEYEFFYHINNSNGGIINQSRIKVGVNYKLNRLSEISCYYLFENEFNVSKPVDSNVLGVSYNLSF